MQEFLRFFSSRGDTALQELLRDISWKMVCHFSEWAKPNEHLLRDELVLFCVVFPSIDLAWRLGNGIPEKGFIEKLLALFGPDDIRNFNRFLEEKGFLRTRSDYSAESLSQRGQEYGARYLIDRQQEKWEWHAG